MTIADCGLRIAKRRAIGASRMRAMRNSRAVICRGFTLVEVLVALAIFAMAAVVLGSAYVNVLNAYEAASRGMDVNEDYTFARQFVLNEPDREKVEQGGDFQTAKGLQARWSAEIESTSIADVFRVIFTCEIDDPTRPEPQKVSETFTLLRPTWSTDAAERDKLKEEAKRRILEIQEKLANQ